MKLKHFFLVFSLLYSFLALAIDQELDSEIEAAETDEAKTAPENITTRLKDEMNFLHQTVEGTPNKPQTVSSNTTVPATTANKPSVMEDLEEKINFRSAAVKKADNHESEVNVDELDSENFE